MTRNTLVRLLAILAISASACSGDNGATGAQGPAGPQGAKGDQGDQGAAGQDGQSGMSAVGGKLKLVLNGTETTTVDGVATSTLTFTVYPAAAVCPGGTCNDNLSILGQKTLYATEYDAATKTFTTAKSFSYSGIKFKGIVDGGKGAQYTAKKANASFSPELSQSAMLYGYIADQTVLPVKGHYSLYDNVSSASKVYGAVEYTSNANVSGCEKCHVAPYSKHGYRQAKVAGLPDFAACKACHTDQRVGSDHEWQKIVDNPADFFKNGVADGERTGKYAYVANVMNDTHMSHAMEFAYPQSMANCVTCHEGKLDAILADSKFTLTTCKSCHPMDGTGGTDPKRAPALNELIKPFATFHPALTATVNCQVCHSTAGGMKPFKQIHAGRTASIYAADGTRYSDVFTTKVDSASFDAATSILTVKFSATKTGGASITQTAADIVPTVVVSLYGYGTKDFVVSGHSSRQLEAAFGATHTRLTWSGTAPNWTVAVNLADWASKIGANNIIQRAEVGVLPVLGTFAVKGVSQTIDLVGTTALVPADKAYGKNIVDAAKCNACHDALGTTFHSPSYGSAGTVGCRLCHVVGSGGSHLEMQSRSIDSYVHAIHSMQPFDMQNMDPTDPIEELRHELHIESTYPSFSILNCESCHNKGTYDVPAQDKSLPSLLSKSAAFAGTRNINNVPVYVVGPASRACGSCHRAELINEDAAGALGALNAHTAAFGTLVANGDATILDTVTQTIMAQIGGPATALVAPAGTQLESCSVCHPNAGAEHQAAFNRWSDGL